MKMKNVTLSRSRNLNSDDRIIAKFAGMSLGVLVVLYALFALVTGACFQYAINAWMAYAGKPPTEFMSYGMCYLLALIPFVGQHLISANP